MRSLLIVGAGGYGRLVKEIAALCGYDRIDFLDDNDPDSVGGIRDLEGIQDRYDGCVVAVGNPDVRERAAGAVRKLVKIVHPTAVISPSALVGDGCVIEANAVISAHARIGRASYLCAGAVVNHDAAVSDYCQVDCNAVVASGAAVPEKTKVHSCTVWEKNRME